MAPVVKQLKSHDNIKSIVCVSAQHRQMLDQVLDLFDIQPDFDLNVMTNTQSLSHVTRGILHKIEDVINQTKPDKILVHGDTTTAMSAALSAFYHKVPVGHVEAGLRTGDPYSPWPEEMNRRLITAMTFYHFAPTQQAADNLIRENIPSAQIYITGNTVIDAILMTAESINKDQAILQKIEHELKLDNTERRIVLVTAHRRENFGKGIQNICKALLKLSQRDDILIIYPVHLNPNIKNTVRQILGNKPNILLPEPLDYMKFVYLMQRSYIIISDSGGIQEEAPSLGKPVLVMRNKTERPEALAAGTVKLVGTDPNNIYMEAISLIDDENKYKKMSSATNPFGDGKAADRIVKILSPC